VLDALEFGVVLLLAPGVELVVELVEDCDPMLLEEELLWSELPVELEAAFG
jgi:hypothetical protein